MELQVNMSITDTDKIDAGYSNKTALDRILSSTGNLSQSEMVEEFIYKKLILAVCVFGIVGNLLNFIVLSEKSITFMMERMEKSAHYGLIALAVSDFFVCLTALPSVIYGTGKKNGGFVHISFDFRLVHKLYGNGVIYTFMLSSTWLTVTMAVSRYIAICHPLKARQIIGKRFTITSLVAVFVFSVVFNVPRFLQYEHRSVVSDGRRLYFAYPGPLKRQTGAELAYLWTYFSLGIIMPLCALLFFNVHLIKTLRTSMLTRFDGQTSAFPRAIRSTAGQRLTRERSEQAAHRITLTLIIIIVLFVVLFVPSELLNFFSNLAAQTSYHTNVFNMAVAIGNLLQAINFAVNFVLYSAINTYFRYTICRMAKCARCRSPDSLEVFQFHRQKSGRTVAGVDGGMVRMSSRISKGGDTEHQSNAVQPPLSTTWMSSRRRATQTVAVSFV